MDSLGNDTNMKWFWIHKNVSIWFGFSTDYDTKKPPKFVFSDLVYVVFCGKYQMKPNSYQ